jgi:hypothetical protein
MDGETTVHERSWDDSRAEISRERRDARPARDEFEAIASPRSRVRAVPGWLPVRGSRLVSNVRLGHLTASQDHAASSGSYHRLHYAAWPPRRT